MASAKLFIYNTCYCIFFSLEFIIDQENFKAVSWILLSGKELKIFLDSFLKIHNKKVNPLKWDPISPDLFDPLLFFSTRWKDSLSSLNLIHLKGYRVLTFDLHFFTYESKTFLHVKVNDFNLKSRFIMNIESFLLLK